MMSWQIIIYDDDDNNNNNCNNKTLQVIIHIVHAFLT